MEFELVELWPKIVRTEGAVCGGAAWAEAVTMLEKRGQAIALM